MTDITDPATRSRMMSGIRSVNTKPEVRLRSLLHRKGFRFKLHDKNLPGKPDIVLPKYHAVIFVNGCFWHGHSCHLFRLPETRRDFWQCKIEKNRSNDARAVNALRSAGWRVATVWECAMRGRTRTGETILVERIAAWLHDNDNVLEIMAGKKD